MQVGHGKCGIEVDRCSIVLHRSARVLDMFPAKCRQIVRTRVQFIGGQYLSANGFGGPYVS